MKTILALIFAVGLTSSAAAQIGFHAGPGGLHGGVGIPGIGGFHGGFGPGWHGGGWGPGWHHGWNGNGWRDGGWRWGAPGYNGYNNCLYWNGWEWVRRWDCE